MLSVSESPDKATPCSQQILLSDIELKEEYEEEIRQFLKKNYGYDYLYKLEESSNKIFFLL